MNFLMAFLLLVKRYFRYETVGLEHIPKRGPALIVMNHGVLPFHSFALVYEIYKKTGVLPRSLAAEFLFKIPVVKDLFEKGGAVCASPENAEKLLRAGHLVTVSPGGIYEGLVTRPDAVCLPWESHFGFAQVACKLGVPIVPTYCRGLNKAYVTSQRFLEERTWLLKRIRFSIPFFFGLGLFPFPVKLTHVIGSPISTKPRKGEPPDRRVWRVHDRTIAAVTRLAEG